MALIKCTECGEQVSDQAATCPKCGAPIHKAKKKSAWTKNIGCAGVMFVVLILLGLLLLLAGLPIGLIIAGAGVLLLLVRLKMWSGVDKK